jgi:hypothetical protein
MSTFFIAWAALCVGFLIGYVLSAVFKRNADAYPEVPSVEVQTITPQAMARMGEALSLAGDMMESGDFAYLSGGLIVQDLGHGVVSIKGDLSLRAVEHE